MRAAAELLAHFVSERADVGSRRALDGETRDGAGDLRQAIFEQLHFDRFQFYGLLFSGEFVSGAAVDFFGGKRWRHLREAANTLGGETLKCGGIQSGRGIRTLGFAVGGAGMGGTSKT